MSASFNNFSNYKISRADIAVLAGRESDHSHQATRIHTSTTIARVVDGIFGMLICAALLTLVLTRELTPVTATVLLSLESISMLFYLVFKCVHYRFFHNHLTDKEMQQYAGAKAPIILEALNKQCTKIATALGKIRADGHWRIEDLRRELPQISHINREMQGDKNFSAAMSIGILVLMLLVNIGTIVLNHQTNFFPKNIYMNCAFTFKLGIGNMMANALGRPYRGDSIMPEKRLTTLLDEERALLLKVSPAASPAAI